MSGHHHEEHKKIWFRRKTYGFGWTPATWEGWSVLIVYVALILWMVKLIDTQHHTASDTLTNFIIRFVVLTLVFIGICYVKGEEPAWTWGDDHEHDQHNH